MSLSISREHPQIDLLPIVPRHQHSDQLAMANKAKAIVNSTLDAVCAPVHPIADVTRKLLPAALTAERAKVNAILKAGVAVAFPTIPESYRTTAVNVGTAIMTSPLVVDASIDVAVKCADKTKETVKNLAGRAIDSDYYYGSEDSYVSRLSRWLASWIYKS
ncbi:MAG: hypothetical protein WC341_16365 [Bacteroidales bacterium]|jgi:hypothetical protein